MDADELFSTAVALLVDEVARAVPLILPKLREQLEAKVKTGNSSPGLDVQVKLPWAHQTTSFKEGLENYIRDAFKAHGLELTLLQVRVWNNAPGAMTEVRISGYVPIIKAGDFAGDEKAIDMYDEVTQRLRERKRKRVEDDDDDDDNGSVAKEARHE